MLKFILIGIDHVVTIFCAALSDIKILFFSRSYWKLTEACKAVESLLFPLKYCYTFIPVLPFDLLEVLDAPTPFIIGVHSDQKLQALINVKIALVFFSIFLFKYLI
jgi:myotubularin-related protein 5/13